MHTSFLVFPPGWGSISKKHDKKRQAELECHPLHLHYNTIIWTFKVSMVQWLLLCWCVTHTGIGKTITRDKSNLLYFHLFFFLAIFFWSIMLKILLENSIFCSKLKASYIASYLTVTSYTLYTSTSYTHHGEL